MQRFLQQEKRGKGAHYGAFPFKIIFLYFHCGIEKGGGGGGTLKFVPRTVLKTNLEIFKKIDCK